MKEGRQTFVQTTTCTDHARRQHVVEVLEESLVLDLLVGEDEGDSLAFLASCAVQVLEVVQQVGHVVGPEETQSQNAEHSFFERSFSFFETLIINSQLRQIHCIFNVEIQSQKAKHSSSFFFEHSFFYNSHHKLSVKTKSLDNQRKTQSQNTEHSFFVTLIINCQLRQNHWIINVKHNHRTLNTHFFVTLIINCQLRQNHCLLNVGSRESKLGPLTQGSPEVWQHLCV